MIILNVPLDKTYQTVYIYAKFTELAPTPKFHILASLSCKAPKGYYAIAITQSKSRSKAIRSLIPESWLHPKPLSLSSGQPIQQSFIQSETSLNQVIK
jgi:hypothetical protein